MALDGIHDAARDFADFANTVLEHWRAWAALDGVPEVLRTRQVFEEGQNGEVSVRDVSEIRRNYRPSVSSHWNDAGLWLLPSARACVGKLLAMGVLLPLQMSAPDGTPIPNPSLDQMLYGLVERLRGLIMAVVEHYDTLEPTEPLLFGAFQQFVEASKPQNRVAWVVAPLVGFSSEVPELHLTESLHLSPFTPAEKTEVFGIAGSSMLPPTQADFQAFTSAAYKLSAKVPFDGVQIGTAVAPEVGQAITAFRLAAPGFVGALRLFEHYGNILSMATLGNHMVQTGIGPDYLLRRDGIAVLQETIRALTLLGPEVQNTVAVSRLNQVYNRKEPEDRVIDCAIALESCLLPDSDNRDLSYKLQMRAAALLAQERPPSETQEFLKVAYAVRSRIVHKGQRLHGTELAQMIRNKLDGQEPTGFVESLHDYTRRIVRHVVLWCAGGKKPERLADDIDGRLLAAVRQHASTTAPPSAS